MAKKKTENIKAAPVLRAAPGGEQPTPTPEQTGTRTYQIMDPWKDRGVVNLVDVKSVDGEVTEVKVNGQPAGGGGGTTITTPIITISDPSEEGITMTGLWLTPDGGSYTGSLSTDNPNVSNFKPVLLNGKGIYYYNSNTLPSSHNQYVEFIEAGEHRKYYMIISGQATITI